jgi:gliding motility-associated-like protein
VEVTVNNCSSTDVIDISYKPLPIVDLGTDTTLCQGEELLLDITTINAFYLWQNNSTNSTYLVSQAGTYWVEVTVDECTTRGTIQVDYNPLPVFDLGKDTSLCYGDILTINSSSPNASYLWQDQSTKSTFDICQPGTYWLVKTIDNCSSSDSILVSFIPVPPLDLGKDTFVCIGQTITLDVTSPNCRYIWQDYSSDPTYFVDQSATYWVEIIDSNCHNFDTIRVEFKNCDCYLFVPNAFTPDVNSLNETFKPSFDCILAEYNFKIFDRWGEKLFETSNPEEAWDGHFKGSVSPIGVYIYRIDYQFEDLEKQTKFGNVTLIR